MPRGSRVRAHGGVALALAHRIPRSWDLSEDARHSFRPAIARELHTLPGTLRVELHLSPEDPRLVDLRRGVLARLARVVPSIEIVTVAAGGTGLFHRPDAAYGEIWYELDGHRVQERSTIEAVVIETVLHLAGREMPTDADGPGYAGFPLVSEPTYAIPIFFVLWPLGIGAVFLRQRRHQ